MFRFWVTPVHAGSLSLFLSFSAPPPRRVLDAFPHSFPQSTTSDPQPRAAVDFGAALRARTRLKRAYVVRYERVSLSCVVHLPCVFNRYCCSVETTRTIAGDPRPRSRCAAAIKRCLGKSVGGYVIVREGKLAGTEPGVSSQFFVFRYRDI